ncbi:MAG: tRNA-dihydrouridine synthase family protein [Termitinemataceae bacterium]
MKVSFFLAPMAAISHRPFRQLVEDFGGCDEYFTEMLSAPALLAANPLEHYYLDNQPVPEKLVYQLVGSDPAVLEQAARLLDEKPCKGIDLNMGCSAPEIVRNGAGAWWLDHPEEAIALAGRLRGAIRNHRFSVKMRLGREENIEGLIDFCKGLEKAGVDLITLHPRTSREKLKRHARWYAVKEVKAALHIPVAGNGDIETAAQLEARAESGCDAVMVGRGAVRAPWIFAEARQLRSEPVDLLATADRFLELLEQHQPPEYFVSRAQKFFLYFCENFTWAHHVRTLLGRKNNRCAMIRVLESYLQDHPQDRYTAMQMLTPKELCGNSL